MVWCVDVRDENMTSEFLFIYRTARIKLRQ